MSAAEKTFKSLARAFLPRYTKWQKQRINTATK
jgi:hypothetical protein